MNAPSRLAADEIITFMGPIPDDEYARRAKLRAFRNAATAMIASTESNTARALAWTAIEWITPTLYAPAPIDWLDRVNHLVGRLLKTAITAEDLDRLVRESANV